MKKILLVFTAVLASAWLYSQNCNPSFPGVTIQVLDAGGSHSTSGDVVWICSGLTVEVSGDGNTVFVEKGSTITLSGDNNTLYQKRGGGALTVSGSSNITYYESGLSFTDNGTSTTSGTCDTLKYDYTNAPMPPDKSCDPFAGSGNELSLEEIKVYPNPATDVLYLDLPLSDGSVDVRLYSGIGQLIQQTIVTDGNMDISSIQPGIYFLQVQTDKRRYSSRVRIE